MSMASFVVTETGMKTRLIAILEMILVIKVNLIFLKTENIFFEILLPNSKPIVVGRIYRPTNKTNFLKFFFENLSKEDTNDIEVYILGGFSIDL